MAILSGLQKEPSPPIDLIRCVRAGAHPNPGNAANAVAHCDAGVGTHVQRGDFRLARILASHGVDCRHPPQPSPQKSTRTGVCDCKTSLLKLESVTINVSGPGMGRWLVPFICRARAYRRSRCCIRPGRRCLPRSSRHAIRAEASVPCLK